MERLLNTTTRIACIVAGLVLAGALAIVPKSFTTPVRATGCGTVCGETGQTCKYPCPPCGGGGLSGSGTCGSVDDGTAKRQ
jgi:hypothetical protein